MGFCLKCYSQGNGGSELHSSALVLVFMHMCAGSQALEHVIVWVSVNSGFIFCLVLDSYALMHNLMHSFDFILFSVPFFLFFFPHSVN